MFYRLCQRRSICWKYKRWKGYFENRRHHAKIEDKKRIIFWSALTAFCCFLEKIFHVFWSSFGICPLQFVSVPLWSCEDIDLKIISQLQCIFTCLSKMAIKTLKENVKFAQTLGHWQGNILTHLMVIKTLFQIR